MSNDGYDRMVELVAENPALEAEELAELATDDGLDAEESHEWLQDTLEKGDVMEFDGKHWVVRTGEYAFGEYNHSES